MLSENEKREIKMYEDAGLHVIATKNGKEVYNSEKNDDKEVCNGCQFLRLVEDPDPYDWFRDSDQKAICELLKAVLYGSLEPRDIAKIHRPVICPYLSDSLDDEQKERAKTMLKYAKKRYKEECQ